MDFKPPPLKRFDVDIGPDQLERWRTTAFSSSSALPATKNSSGCAASTKSLLAMPATGIWMAFSMSRPYGSTAQPQLGQLLLPERFVTRIQETSFWQNARRISSRLLALPEPKLESWCHLIFKGATARPKRPWHQEAHGTSTRNSMRLRRGSRSDDVDTNNGVSVRTDHTAATSKRIGTAATIRRCTYSNSTNRPTRAALCRFRSRLAA